MGAAKHLNCGEKRWSQWQDLPAPSGTMPK
jgi:hypothetical protein